MTDTVSIPVEEASDEQLRWFVEHVLGIPLARKAVRREELLARLHQAGHTGPIQAMAGHGAAPVPPAAEGAGLVPGSYQAGQKARIIIDRQDGPGGDRPVFVGVNGSSILIPRGEPVAVGLPYVEALANATQTLFDQSMETGEVSARDVPAYPFRVLQTVA